VNEVLLLVLVLEATVLETSLARDEGTKKDKK